MADRLEVDMIVKAISQGFDKVSQDMKKIDGATSTVGTSAVKTASRMDILKGAMTTAGVTAGIVSAAVVGAWKAMTAGAELDAAKRQFGNLADTIGISGDQLQWELRQAGRGMMTEAETIQAATDIINTGLADTKDEAVFLTTAVSRLGLNMNQLTMTLLNDSTMRLDALKLSAERVKQIQDDLKASGATGDIFDQAVFIALQEKMDTLGDSSDYAAGGLERFKNRLIDGKNAVLEFIGAATGPAFGKVADYMDELDARQLDLNNAVRLGIVTQEEAATILALANRGYDEWETRLAEVRAEVEKLQPELERLNELQDALNYAAENSVSTYDDIVAMEALAAKARQRATWELMREEEEQRAATDAASGGAEALAELTAAKEKEAAMTLAQIRHNKMLYDAQRELNEAQREMTRLRTQQFLDATTDSLIEYTTTATWAGGRTEEQQANFEELSGAAERVRDNIRSLTGGTAGLGLTEEELNKKLEEQYEKLGQIEGSLGPLSDIQREMVSSSSGWSVNLDLLNEQMTGYIVAAGASAEETGRWMVASDQMTKSAYMQAQNTILMQAQMEALAQQYKDGTISLSELKTGLDDIVANSPYVTVFDLEENNARGKLQEIAGQLDALDGRHVRSTVEIVETGGGGGKGGGDKDGGTPPSGPPPSGPPPPPASPPPGGSLPPGAASYGATGYAVTGAGINISFAGAIFQGTSQQMAAQMAQTVADKIGRL